MITEADPKPPQIEHLFVRGLRFEGELQYLAKASGRCGPGFREVRAPKARRDGGLAWCSAVAGGILRVWPLAGHAQPHDGWRASDAGLIERLILSGGLALVQLGDGYFSWWALVTGVERDRTRPQGVVTALLLLDVSQGLPWGSAYSARVDGLDRAGPGALEWRCIDGAQVAVGILRWVGVHSPATA